MTDTEKEGFEFADLVSRQLEEILVRYFGDDAAWINAEMTRKPPDEMIESMAYMSFEAQHQVKVFSKLWELRQEANDVAHYIQENPEKTIESLQQINKQQFDELAASLHQLIQSKKTQDNLIRHFERFKTDALDRFRAIKVLVSASIRNGDIRLNHHVRDERLKHLSDVIDAQVSDCGCFKLRSYDDDF